MDSNLRKLVQDSSFLNEPQGSKKHPDHRFDVKVGDTVVVYSKIVMKMKVKHRLTAAQKQAMKKAMSEGKTAEEIAEANIKTQAFKGVVIAIKGSGKDRMITVRKIGANGIGVEKIFPMFSPVVVRIEVVKQGKPRRSKLYYLRNRIGRKATKVRNRDANRLVQIDNPQAIGVTEEKGTKVEEVKATPAETND